MNTDSQFKKFYDDIQLSPSEMTRLKGARDALRAKARKYFCEKLNKPQPKFYQQGSFALRTIIKPIDGEVDIDDGLYLQDLPVNRVDWPKTEYVRKNVIDAVDNHTEKGVEDKPSCIRVIYANDYHVDIPVYGICNGRIYLARKGSDQWVESDPKKVVDWFRGKLNEHGEQFRRVISYMKAWKDFKGLDFPSIIITFLVGISFVKYDRDDSCLLDSVSSIIFHLENYSQINNPADEGSGENLLQRWTLEEKQKLIGHLKEMRKMLTEAIGSLSVDEAAKLLLSLFGDRFPMRISGSTESRTDRTKTITEAPSRPWRA